MSERDPENRPRDRANELRKIQMPDGGEVVAGPLAREALSAVGARAMTVDKTIFVSDDFDPNDPEDQALYAHERHHQKHSGGESEHGGGQDAEELAAKAVERMVLHRAARGESFGAIMQDVEAGRIDQPSEVGGAPDAGREDGDDPMAAYRALRAQGWEHDAIVRLLARHVMLELQSEQRTRAVRAPIGPSLFGRDGRR
jgi:hypothetical protein